MKQDNGKGSKPLYTLIPLDSFKGILGVDDRDDTMSEYCLMTASYTVEQYCKRRFLRKKYFEHIAFTGDLVLPLREYPVTEILIAHVIPDYREPSQILEPDFYNVIPECGTFEDVPANLELSPALRRYPKLAAIEIIYYAGYARDDVPPDLAMACLELASWNMNRYKGRRIGMTGSVRSGGKDGEHFELSMPQNVRFLLEPYRRKTV